ncbi:hypothetical protein ERJ75_000743400 [Trypanosoma vivax]|uniref:Uncharacterized protein n=1 Tax=Trypanosoma vivax (strain Y486) TaxID=1055687 RepID=G0TYS1_TRYVY|nr:hypothetical protein TRVL_03940 [Trypanosoma vivax]KAH8614201.1 hypothetical protein ERJ75_000743400 [Trypanosoma vivax]CCC49120.1 conserved hypothetical protein [Trypanosoma vivax Y486]
MPAVAGLPSVDRDFLHRCCVQVSSLLGSDAAVDAEAQHILRFARHHAGQHSLDIATALVWRIVDTDDDEQQDRLGAWRMLNAVLSECVDSKQKLSCTTLAENICSFLPYLIPYRWYTTQKQSGKKVTTTRDTLSPAVRLLSECGPVVSASVLTGGSLRPDEERREQVIRNKYHSLLSSWRTVWRNDVYQRFKSLAHKTERKGNMQLSEVQRHLHIEPTFCDSLRRLRRPDPCPSLAHQILSCYGWPAAGTNKSAGFEAESQAVAGNDAANKESDTKSSDAHRHTRSSIPIPSLAEVDALDSTMHPHVRRWLHKLVESEGGCRYCDTWLHSEARCPCELPFLKFPNLTSGSHNSFYRRRSAGKVPTMTQVQAVEKLYQHNIRLPFDCEKVLDAVVKLIQEESPYDTLLEAFDTVRGAVTGPKEQHALWVHARYALLPSRTVFNKPTDGSLSPSMVKVEAIFKKKRRFLEWETLLQSVELLDERFRRAELSEELNRSIERVRAANSFLFCLIDGSLEEHYAPSAYARLPDDVDRLRQVKDILCHHCLKPFHVAERCTEAKEHWDLRVARCLLEEHQVSNIKLPDEHHLLDEALQRIVEGDETVKELRRNELRLAVKLVHENRVPYCKVCSIMGHSTRRCEVAARRTLEGHRIQEVDMLLDPQVLQQRVKELRKGHNERDAGLLLEAWNTLGKNRAYPDTFLIAIRELDDARIPLAAARYSTDAVQGFLLFIKSSDLLQHLQPMREENFPDVCLFCDSYHHASDACERANVEERDFLGDLRCYGLTLWEYLRKPEWYDERLPTDFTKGRNSVVKLARQFGEDYSPGGIARQRFIEQNGLQSDAVLLGSPEDNVSLIAVSTGGGGLPVVDTSLSLYGSSFSRLVLCNGEGEQDVTGSPFIEDEGQGRVSGENGLVALEVGRKRAHQDDGSLERDNSLTQRVRFEDTDDRACGLAKD